ncbi:hypothetical protein ACSBR2_030489 [Camellia fascicularis]
MSFEQYSDNEHMCGVAVHTVKNRRLRSDLVLDIFAQRIRDKPLTRSTDVAFDLKKKYGLEISYRVAWLGVKKARGELFGAHSASFDQLRWYSGAMMEHNPSTYISIDCNEHDNHFERFFISFKACIDGSKHYRPLLFLDGTFLKGSSKGIYLLPRLRMEIERNLRDKLKYMHNFHRIGLIAKFNNCAYAPIITAFQDMVVKFTNSGKKIATDFLENLRPRHWENAYFKCISFHNPVPHFHFSTYPILFYK